MIEAMWTLTFTRPSGESGYGVMVLETGRIFGGDSSFCFIGTYRTDRDTLVARVRVSRHSNALVNIFGIDNFDLTLRGQIASDRLILDGFMDGASDAMLQVVAVRKAELP